MKFLYALINNYVVKLNCQYLVESINALKQNSTKSRKKRKKNLSDREIFHPKKKSSFLFVIYRTPKRIFFASQKKSKEHEKLKAFKMGWTTNSIAL